MVKIDRIVIYVGSVSQIFDNMAAIMRYFIISIFDAETVR